ncbi:MAG: MCE family protein, partial [Acidimicrobiales bacterium]
ESLVKAGNDLLGALGAAGTSALARIVQEQARGFGPEGGDLRLVLDNLNTVVVGYASRTQVLQSVLRNLDAFSSTLGPNAQANAEALANLGRATEALDRQKERLVTLLRSLATLAGQGASLLDADLSAITSQLGTLRTVTQALANQQEALGKVLLYFYGHNLATSRGVSRPDDFIQVLNQFFVCGLGPNPAKPGSNLGGDTPGSPTDSCYSTGTGKP